MATDNNDMRKLLGKMRNIGNPKVNEYTAKGNQAGTKKEMTMRDMLAITRKKRLSEAVQPQKEMVSSIDKKQEEEKMENYFDNKVNIEFDELMIYDMGVWFGGVINNVLKWEFGVGKDENLNIINIELLEKPTEKPEAENSVSSMESIEELTEKLKAYYNYEFKPYWIQNHLQK